MAGSFGILLFVLFVGASNLALGYAAAVYFGKARLELVWFTWQVPSLSWPTWFARSEQPAEPAQRYAADEPTNESPSLPKRAARPAAQPAPTRLLAESRPAVPASDFQEDSPGEATPEKPTSSHSAASPAETDLEASLSAYSAAANKRAPIANVSEDEAPSSDDIAGGGNDEAGAPFAASEIAPEAWELSPAGESDSADASLSTLLDDLVAQNLSELEDAFAQIDHNASDAEVAADAREAVAAY